MSYTINRTNGTVLTTLLDGTTNTETGLTLIGRNYITYGEIQNENFVRLLENFSDNIPPGQSVGFAPLSGQLWWDSGNNRLKVYDGEQFVSVSERTVSSSTPADGVKTGDQWWDTTNNQLKTYNGNAWLLIGPPYTTSQGKSGAIVETITDTNNVNHTVVNTYTNGNLIAVSSFGQEFTPNVAGYLLFSTIKPGINLAGNAILNGSTADSQKLGSQWANVYARTDIVSNFATGIGVAGNLSIGYGNISYNQSNTFVISNTALNGNIEVYVKSSLGNIRALHIQGSNGLASVSGDPTNTYHIATKNYVDNTASAIEANLEIVENNLNSALNNLDSDFSANLGFQIYLINQNAASTNSNVSALDTAFKANVDHLVANLNAANAHISSVESVTAFLSNIKANIDSPRLTGYPTTTHPQALIDTLNSLNTLNRYVSLTQPMTVNIDDYIEQVDAIEGKILSNAQSLVGGTFSNLTVRLISGVVTTGNTIVMLKNGSIEPGTHVLASGGTGTLPAYLGIGDNSTRIATTQYVDITANILHGDYNTKISALRNDTSTFISANTSPLAPKTNPEFIGQATMAANSLPSALTWSTSSASATGGTSSSQLATTAFVSQSISGQKFNYTVSTGSPTGGNDGDFWFKVG